MATEREMMKDEKESGKEKVAEMNDNPDIERMEQMVTSMKNPKHARHIGTVAHNHASNLESRAALNKKPGKPLNSLGVTEEAPQGPDGY